MEKKDYIKWIRGKVGHEKIIIVYAGGCIFNEKGEVLLQKRADCNKWGFPGGALELGETPEMAAKREVMEETGLDVEVGKLIGVYTDCGVVCANGDQVQSICIGYEMTVAGGELVCDKDETLELKYFPLDDMPELFCKQHEELLKDISEKPTNIKKTYDQFPHGCVKLKKCDFENNNAFEVFRVFNKQKLLDDNERKNLIKSIKENLISSEKVWALFGTIKKSNDISIEQSDEEWICLQVANSNDICKEIISDIKCMAPVTKADKKRWRSQFHRDGVFDAVYGLDVRCQKYRNICEKFNCFCIVLINPEEYLKGIDISGYERVKYKYAEVKFAFETKALYWNPIKEEYKILYELEIEEFIKQRDIKFRNDEHLKVIKCFYPYLRSVSSNERLLPSALENILGIDLTDISVVTACFNGVNDGSKAPYENVDLYIKLNNDIKVFVYGRNQKDIVELKGNEYVVCLVADEITNDIKRNGNHHIFVE